MNLPGKLILGASLLMGTPACNESEPLPIVISDVISETKTVAKEQSTPVAIKNQDLADSIPAYVEGFPEAGEIAKKWFPIARFAFQKFIEKKQEEAKIFLLKQSKTKDFDADIALSAFVETVDNPTYHYSTDGNSVDIQFFGTTDGKEFKDYLFDRIAVANTDFKIPLKLGVMAQSPLDEKKAIITVDAENTYGFNVYAYNNEGGSNGYSVGAGFALEEESLKMMETLSFNVSASGNSLISYCNETLGTFCTNSDETNDDGSSKLNIPEHMELVDNLF